MPPTFFDGRGYRALIRQSTGVGASAAYGYLVDLRTGRKRRVSVPVETVHAAWGPRGRRLYAYAKSGDLWALDTRTGRVVNRRRVRTRGLGVGFVYPGALVVVGRQAIHFHDPTTLLRRQSIRLARIYPGYGTTRRCAVTNGKVVALDGDKAVVVDIAR